MSFFSPVRCRRQLHLLQHPQPHLGGAPREAGDHALHVGLGQPRGRAEDLLAELRADDKTFRAFSTLFPCFFTSFSRSSGLFPLSLEDALRLCARGHRCIEPHLPRPLLVFHGCGRGGRWRGGAMNLSISTWNLRIYDMNLMSLCHIVFMNMYTVHAHIYIYIT